LLNASTAHSITLTGCIRHPEYHIAKDILQAFVAQTTTVGSLLKTVPCCDLDYINLRQAKKKEFNLIDNLYPTTFTAIDTLEDGKKQGETRYHNLESLIKWTQESQDFFYKTEKTEEDYLSEAGIEFLKFLSSFKNPLIYITISIDNQPAGKLFVELLADKCPKTVAHFLSFVEGEYANAPNYSKSAFTRLVENGWIQGGEIETLGGQIIREPAIPDENFVVKHSSRGIISMVNAGPNTAVSSFSILLSPSMTYFDQKYVAFARVIEGETTLKNMESVDCRFERPTQNISISDIKTL